MSCFSEAVQKIHPFPFREDNDNYVIDHFEKTPPMSTFTFGFILTQLHRYNFGDIENTTPINFWATKSNDPAGEILIKVIHL